MNLLTFHDSAEGRNTARPGQKWIFFCIMIGQYAKNVAFNGSESSDISESFPVISPSPDITIRFFIGGGRGEKRWELWDA